MLVVVTFKRRSSPPGQMVALAHLLQSLYVVQQAVIVLAAATHAG